MFAREHPILSRLWDLYKDLLAFFFPPICVSCGEKLSRDDEHFCSACRSTFTSVPRPQCPTCGAPLGNKVIEGKRCPNCPQDTIYFDRARAPLLYEGAIADGIIALKFHSRPELAELFGRILFFFLRTRLKDLRIDGIVPVPLHPRRFYTRGFNQAEEIANTLSKLSGLPIWGEVLRRTRHTRPQTRLPHSLRGQNVMGAFVVTFAEPIRQRHVILLDDVYTTGSTLNACAGALKRAGAREITALTVCRAVKMS